jgi:hypothetical protein
MVRSIIPLLTCALLAAAPALASELVPVPHFKSVVLRGGGDLVVQNAPVQRVTLVEGSSRYTSVRVGRDDKLTIDVCNSDCPRNYRLKVIVESPTVPYLAVDGGGKISTAAGFGGQQEVVAAINGGGVIDATSVSAAKATAAVDGGGEIKVRALRALTAAVNGGGVVRYWGDPQVTSAIDGGGEVRRGY